MKRILELAKGVLNEVDDIQKSDISTINNTHQNNTSQTPIQKFIGEIPDPLIKERMEEINKDAPMGGSWCLNLYGGNVWFNFKGRWVGQYLDDLNKKRDEEKAYLDSLKPNRNTYRFSKDGKVINNNNITPKSVESQGTIFDNSNGINLTSNSENAKNKSIAVNAIKRNLKNTIDSINNFKEKIAKDENKSAIAKSIKLPDWEDIKFIIDKQKDIGGLSNDMLYPTQSGFTFNGKEFSIDNINSATYKDIIESFEKGFDISIQKILSNRDLTPSQIKVLINVLKKELANSIDINNEYGHKLSENNIKIAYYFSQENQQDIAHLQTPEMWFLYYNRYVKSDAKGIPLSVPTSQVKISSSNQNKGSIAQKTQVNLNQEEKNVFTFKLYYDIADTEVFDADNDPYEDIVGLKSNLTGEVNNLVEKIYKEKDKIISNYNNKNDDRDNNKNDDRDNVYLYILNNKLETESTNLEDAIRLFNDSLVEEEEIHELLPEDNKEKKIILALIHILLACKFSQNDLAKKIKRAEITNLQLSESSASIFGSIVNIINNNYLKEIDSIIDSARENPENIDNKDNYINLDQDTDFDNNQNNNNSLNEITNNGSEMHLRQLNANDILKLVGIEIIPDNLNNNDNVDNHDDINLMEIKNTFYNIFNKIK